MKKWKTRLTGIALILATLLAGIYDFPFLWNDAAGFVQAKTGWQPPALDEKAYRLGLDLQGGTHLVYEADMSQIPEEDREEALEGVRDVIERRVNAFGVAEPVVQVNQMGDNWRLIVELAGVKDTEAATTGLSDKLGVFTDIASEQLKQAYAFAEKSGPVIMNCIMDQHLVNKAVIGPVYSLMYVHIPWDELPLRGKHSRRSTMKGYLPALNDLPPMPPFDAWEPLKEEELGYPPKDDYFKA